MALKEYKPTSPGQRSHISVDRSDLSKAKPTRSLTRGKPKKAGRNFRGKITVRHQGGGHKRKFRQIDFKRLKDGIPAKVAGIEYDPNRSARIALLFYADGEKRYIIAPHGLEAGAEVMSGPGRFA